MQEDAARRGELKKWNWQSSVSNGQVERTECFADQIDAPVTQCSHKIMANPKSVTQALYHPALK
jgi:hypothetical protein